MLTAKWLNDSPARRRHYASTLQWYEQPILEIGDWVWTRNDLVLDLGCGNFIAATRLTRAMRAMKIDSVASLHRIGLLGLLRIAGVGERSAWVAACALEDRGYDVEDWFGRDNLPSRTTIARAAKKTRKHGKHT